MYLKFRSDFYRIGTIPAYKLQLFWEKAAISVKKVAFFYVKKQH